MASGEKGTDDQGEAAPREFLEARVVLADWQVDRFLSFCERELGLLPSLSRVPDESVRASRRYYELLANQDDGRTHEDLEGPSRN